MMSFTHCIVHALPQHILCPMPRPLPSLFMNGTVHMTSPFFWRQPWLRLTASFAAKKKHQQKIISIEGLSSNVDGDGQCWPGDGRHKLKPIEHLCVCKREVSGCVWVGVTGFTSNYLVTVGLSPAVRYYIFFYNLIILKPRRLVERGRQ